MRAPFRPATWTCAGPGAELVHVDPCGRAVDWIQFPFEVDAVIHNGPDAPVVRQRWTYTTQPFLPPGTHCVLNNRIWNSDDVSELRVGMLPIDESEYVQDARYATPPDLPANHICHPEWLSVGEPWPNSLPRTVRDRDGAPLCCRRPMPLEFQNGTMDPVNGQPASQLQQYAVTFADVTPTTPFHQLTVGDAIGGAGPNVPGFTWGYFPLGSSAGPGWTYTVLASGAGVMQSTTEQFVVDANNNYQRTVTATGRTEQLEAGGVTTTFTLTVAGGVGLLSGSNLKLDQALLPAGVEVRATAGYLAAGTTQATATAITTTGAQCVALNTAHGVRLPTATATGNRLLTVVHTDASPVASLKLYPASGQALSDIGTNLPYTLNKGAGVLLVENGGENGNWKVIPY